MKTLALFIAASILFGNYSCKAQKVTYKLYPAKEYHGRHKRSTVTVISEPACKSACGHSYTCIKLLFDKFEYMEFLFRKVDTQMIGIPKDYPNKGCQESVLFDLNDSTNTVRMEAWNSPIEVSTKLEKKTVNSTGNEYSYSFGYIIPSTSDYLLYIIFDKNFNIVGVTYSMLDFPERNGEVEFRKKSFQH